MSVLSRVFRFLLAVLSVVVVCEVLLFVLDAGFSERVFVGFLDFRFCRGYSYASTFLLAVLGLVLVVFGRGSSAVYVLFGTRFQEPLIGMTYNVVSLRLLSPLIPGAFSIAIASMIHSVLGRPIIVDAKSLGDVVAGMRRWFRTVFSRRIGLVSVVAVVLTAFLFRFGVEFTCGSMVIGGDTPEYMAHLLDFTALQLIQTRLSLVTVCLHILRHIYPDYLLLGETIVIRIV